MSTYSHPDSLRGRNVIVTGAARGVGRGIAAALLERGASVLMVDKQHDALEATAEELGGTHEQLTADLRDTASAQLIVDTAVARFGSLHGLVNNAIASNEPKPFTEITSADYDLVYDVGPRATFGLMQAAFPELVRSGGGSVVNLGSSSGTSGGPAFGAYAGAKEAIRGMSKVAAVEWGRQGVRVNVICPFAESDGIRAWRELAPRAYESALKQVPLGRVGDPRTDVGALVGFLLSDDAAFITAQTIFVDGGMGTFR